MASATWDTLFDGRTDLIRKMLFGSVLIKDYDPAVSLATFSPFDSTTGGLSSTLVSGHGLADMGYLDENGVKFAPTTATADTLAWQSRLPLRTDFTSSTEKASAVFLQSSPVVEAVFHNKVIPLTDTLGQEAYEITDDLTPAIIYRSVLFLGVDGSGADVQYAWKLYPKALMTKPSEQDWQAKKEVQYGMEFTPYPDPVAGFAVTRGREGPGWRSLAPVTP
jgi:hypothetical protein